MEVSTPPFGKAGKGGGCFAGEFRCAFGEKQAGRGKGRGKICGKSAGKRGGKTAAEGTRESVEESTQETSEAVLISLSVVNCRESITLRPAPSTDSGEICQIPLGAEVGFVAGAEDGFYEIRYEGQQGYALSSYLGEAGKQK